MLYDKKGEHGKKEYRSSEKDARTNAESVKNISQNHFPRYGNQRDTGRKWTLPFPWYSPHPRLPTGYVMITADVKAIKAMPNT